MSFLSGLGGAAGATAADMAAADATAATAGGAVDPTIGWTEDPYISAQTVPQDVSGTGANDPGVFDTGGLINPNSTLGQGLAGLGGALSTLNKAQNASGGSQKAGGPAPLNMQNAQAPGGAGTSRGNTASLAALLAALDARRNLLLQSATSGQARPVANMANPAAGGATRQTTGLLGV